MDKTITVEAGFDAFGTPCFHVMINGRVWMSLLYEAMAKQVANQLATPPIHPSVTDVSTITEYGLTQKLSNSIRCF